METLLINQADFSTAISLLKKGELVAFPTETVYGLGASVFSEEAIQKIYQVKGRPQDNPLIAHIAHLVECEKLAQDLPATFFQLATAFFPGPLTLIVKRHPRVPSIVSAGLETIALRMPSLPLANQLIREFGEPLVAPSANLSGRPSSTTAEHVLHDFQGKIAGVMDGGPCSFGMESTVVDLVSFQRPTLLRYGVLKKEAIEKVLGLEVAVYSDGPRSSPGMKYRHYAPNLPVSLITERKELKRSLEESKNILVLSTEKHPFFSLPLESKTLYANLRLAEEKGYEKVVIFCPDGIEEALQNRLEKIIHSI